MPNLPAHIDLAYDVALRLNDARLNPYIGYFLLGSTAPDMRAMTRGTRREYHFASLEFESVGDGARGLLDAHPGLRPEAGCEGRTLAFVAGYVTHLVLDETWIFDMYRPRFGNPVVFQDRAKGQVMDRALQLELDRSAHESLPKTVPLLSEFDNGIHLDFVPAGTLAEWHQWVLNFVDRGFDWERLRFMARRIAAGDDEHPAHGLANEFLAAMPVSLDDLFGYVSRDELSRFRGQAVQTVATHVGHYLS